MEYLGLVHPPKPSHDELYSLFDPVYGKKRDKNGKIPASEKEGDQLGVDLKSAYASRLWV